MRRKPWNTRLAAWTPFAPGWVHTVHWTKKLLNERTRGKEMTGTLKGEKPLQNGKSPPSSFPLHSLSSTIDLFFKLWMRLRQFFVLPMIILKYPKHLCCDFISHLCPNEWQKDGNNEDGHNQYCSLALLLVVLALWEGTFFTKTKRDWLGTEPREQMKNSQI